MEKLNKFCCFFLQRRQNYIYIYVYIYTHSNKPVGKLYVITLYMPMWDNFKFCCFLNVRISVNVIVFNILWFIIRFRTKYILLDFFNKFLSKTLWQEDYGLTNQRNRSLCAMLINIINSWMHCHAPPFTLTVFRFVCKSQGYQDTTGTIKQQYKLC